MGGGGGSGGMFRTAGRLAVRAKIAALKPTTEPNPSLSSSISATSAPGDDAQTQNQLFISSPTHRSAPLNANSGFDEFDWVSVDEVGDETLIGFFGHVPSSDEVQSAVSALQQVVDYPNLGSDRYSYNVGREIVDYVSSPNDSMRRGSSDGYESDWMEPSMNLYASGVLHPYGSNKVYDAFHRLRTDPSIQKMVISLSSDQAVWDAVLNNEAVRELRESYYTVDRRIEQISDEESGDSKTEDNIVKWIFDSTKAKVMEVMEKISMIVNELFNSSSPPEGEATAAGATDPFKEKLQASFMLSVVVLVIVFVARASKG